MRRSASEHVRSLTFRLHRSPFTRWWPRGQRHWLFKINKNMRTAGCHHLNNTAGCRREKKPFLKANFKNRPSSKVTGQKTSLRQVLCSCSPIVNNVKCYALFLKVHWTAELQCTGLGPRLNNHIIPYTWIASCTIPAFFNTGVRKTNFNKRGNLSQDSGVEIIPHWWEGCGGGSCKEKSKAEPQCALLIWFN